LRGYLAPEKNRLCEDCRGRLTKNVLRILDCKSESCRAVTRNSPKAKDFLCKGCSDHYNTVMDILNKQGLSTIEDPNMVRGLDYYTNTVFEVTHPGLGAQDALAAGGRYDNLVEDLGGKPAGAFGFAIGMERLLMALTSENLRPTEHFKPQIYFVLPKRDTKAIVKALEIRDALHERKDDIYCEINLEEKSLKSQMRQADKRGARLVVIMGEDELSRDEAVVRNMKSSAQTNVKLCDLVNVLVSDIKKGSD
ncbi:MAG: histidine--tRNA ligase, partial [Candidatus Omnitrophica bacterium]|nr:histidine--tRNA ligase [Candidatus Omnitrophota bacterium]